MSGREGTGRHDKTAYEGAQPGVSMAWVRVMEGLQRRKREEGKKGEGRGQACTNEPQKMLPWCRENLPSKVK